MPENGKDITLNMTDKVFDPYNPDIPLDELDDKFSKLSLKEKKFVVGALKEAQLDLKKRMEKMSTHLPDDMKSSSKSKGGEKSDTSENTGTSEKFKKTPINVIVKFTGLETGEKQKSFEMVKSDRLGTLRIRVEEWLHLKRGTKLRFTHDDGSSLGEKQSPGTFLYTLKIEDGTVLRARTQNAFDNEESEKNKKEQEDALLIPIGGNVAGVSEEQAMDGEPADEDEQDDEDENDTSSNSDEKEDA